MVKYSDNNANDFRRICTDFYVYIEQLIIVNYDANISLITDKLYSI
jgi:hypothetical protein